MTENQNKKLELMKNCSRKVINGNTCIITIQNYEIRHACKFERKCLDGTSCENFQDYFKNIEHTQKNAQQQISSEDSMTGN